MTTHTPGPWEVKLTAGVRIIEVADKSDYQVATVNPFNGADEANARLIAAAPEMLASLTEVISAIGAILGDTLVLDPNDENDRELADRIDRARALLAKIGG